ncbi:MAG: hypothetical protein WKF67_04135 [Rubrobacteraceae bacterium]
MTTFLALLCFTLACAQMAALFAILFRYAIPRSPGFFHLLCAPALLASVFALFSLGFLLLLPDDTRFLGLPTQGWGIVFLAAELITWTTLDLYAVYHAYRVRNERVAREIQEQSAMLAALGKAEKDREARAEEVKQTLKVETEAVKGRLDAASEVVREDAEAVKTKLDEARVEVQDDARHVRNKLDAAEEQLREEAGALHGKMDAIETNINRVISFIESEHHREEE